MTKLSQLNSKLIENLNETHDLNNITTYYFRSVKDIPNLLISWEGRRRLKETPKLCDNLHGGVAVILARENQDSDTGIISISLCHDEDCFDRSKGRNIALRRMLNYVSKSETDSWNYNPLYHGQLTNINTNNILESLVNYLNHSDLFKSRSLKIIE